jgi:hypothetical protein
MFSSQQKRIHVRRAVGGGQSSLFLTRNLGGHSHIWNIAPGSLVEVIAFLPISTPHSVKKLNSSEFPTLCSMGKFLNKSLVEEASYAFLPLYMSYH